MRESLRRFGFCGYNHALEIPINIVERAGVTIGVSIYTK